MKLRELPVANIETLSFVGTEIMSLSLSLSLSLSFSLFSLLDYKLRLRLTQSSKAFDSRRIRVYAALNHVIDFNKKCCIKHH
jgi:hypothetical protein